MTLDELYRQWDLTFDVVSYSEATSPEGHIVVSGWGKHVWYDDDTRSSGSVVFADLSAVANPVTREVLEHHSETDEESEYAF